MLGLFQKHHMLLTGENYVVCTMQYAAVARMGRHFSGLVCLR